VSFCADYKDTIPNLEKSYLYTCPTGWGILAVSAWDWEILIAALPSQTLDVKVGLSA